MATLAPAQLVFLANEWEKLYGSAVLSGIVGDLAHKLRGGYHISIQDQPGDNYSVTKVDDKAPPGNWPRNMASAVDMTMSTADMKKCHIRLRNAWNNRSRDVRMKYINAWNGWDGQGDAGRYDVVKGTVGTATSDHKWHIHLEIRRRYVNDRNAMIAILSILKGESLETYLGEDDVTKDEFKSWMTEWATSAPGRDAIAVAVLSYDPGKDASGKIKPGGVENMGSNPESNPTATPAWGLRQAQLAATLGYAIRDSLPSMEQRILNAVANTTSAVDVDEVALGAAIANNPLFVEALATAVAAKIQGGQDVAEAVRSVLNDAKIVVN